MTFLRKQIRGSGVPFVPQAAKTYFEPTDAIDATNVQDAIEAISAGKFDPTFGDVTASGLTIGSLNGMLKGVSGVVSVATKGTDYPGLDYANVFTALQTFQKNSVTSTTNGDDPVVTLYNATAGASGATRQGTKLNAIAYGYSGGASQKVEWSMVFDAKTDGNPEWKIYVEEGDSGSWTKIVSIDADGRFLSPLKYGGAYAIGATIAAGVELTTGGAASGGTPSHYSPRLHFEGAVYDGSTSRMTCWDIYSAPYSAAAYAAVIQFRAGRNTYTPSDNVACLWWDGTNKRIGVGTDTPAYAADIVGEINASTGYRVGGSAGATGSFTTADSKTVTVTAGLITAIV